MKGILYLEKLSFVPSIPSKKDKAHVPSGQPFPALWINPHRASVELGLHGTISAFRCGFQGCSNFKWKKRLKIQTPDSPLLRKKHCCLLTTTTKTRLMYFVPFGCIPAMSQLSTLFVIVKQASNGEFLLPLFALLAKESKPRCFWAALDNGLVAGGPPMHAGHRLCSPIGLEELVEGGAVRGIAPHSARR
jgi:hypothetical protein